MSAVDSHQLHRHARDWALERLNLSEREGEDRLFDDRGRSYKVKARTAPETGAVTSFDFRDPVPEFDLLVGVQVGADGVTVSEAFVVDRATFDDRAHRNQGSVRFRLSASGPERAEVRWLVGGTSSLSGG